MDFQFNQIPFSFLQKNQREFLLKNMDMAYFAKDAFLQEKDVRQNFVYVIIKGRVLATRNRDHSMEPASREFLEGDCVGNSSILSGDSAFYLSAAEDTLCHQLDGKTFLKLVAENEAFATFFQGRLKARYQMKDPEKASSGLGDFMITKISEVHLNDPLICPPSCSIAQAVKKMRKEKADCVLVRSDSQTGIVTRTDLLDALIIGERRPDSAISEIATFPVLKNAPEDPLFQALIKMTGHHVARVVVEKEGEILGVLELGELLAQLSHKSHMLAMRIASCNSVEEAIRESGEINREIFSLASHDASPKLIAELASALNGHLMKKIMDLTLPEGRKQDTCLLALGSEGRSEQILKTDQDNALILKDNHGWQEGELRDFCEQFIAHLESCGYPPCKGKVMINNPFWVKTLSGWDEQVRDWEKDLGGENLMNLAILIDARPVCGNATLFHEFKKNLEFKAGAKAAFFRLFAQPVFNFATPLGLLGGVKSERGKLDIKKSGIFPLVHGVRVLAMEAGIGETNTFARLDRLVAKQSINERLATDLSLALELFLKLRLKRQIRKTQNKQSPGNQDWINIRRFSRLERSLLHDSLQAVQEFKDHLGTVFHVDF